MNHTRRSFLAVTAGVSSAALAGCLGEEESTSFEEHTSTAGAGDQPALGSLDTSAVVVAFEDPSCTECRRFETETFPRLSEHVEAGDLAFVYRTLDITFPWSRAAAQLMASTYAADNDAFWVLKDFYYENQSEFESDTVFDLTEEFLRSETSVDVETVVDDATEEAHDALVESNRQAAEELDLTATPGFYLFRDGEFRTSISGPQDYDVFANSLGFE